MLTTDWITLSTIRWIVTARSTTNTLWSQLVGYSKLAKARNPYRPTILQAHSTQLLTALTMIFLRHIPTRTLILNVSLTFWTKWSCKLLLHPYTNLNFGYNCWNVFCYFLEPVENEPKGWHRPIARMCVSVFQMVLMLIPPNNRAQLKLLMRILHHVPQSSKFQQLSFVKVSLKAIEPFFHYNSSRELIDLFHFRCCLTYKVWF